MNKIDLRTLAPWLALSLTIAPTARSQWAVIDAPALAQLVHQVETMRQQLVIAREQLQQAEQQMQSMSGDRGMERLLAGSVRNYLPPDWAQILDLRQTPAGGFGAMGAEVRAATLANAVLPPARLATLGAADQQRITAARQRAATSQVLAQAALANSSSRFAAIQRLIDAIPAAADQKAILDLHARIGAELGMLQNEQIKLQALFQAMQAEEAVDRQRQLEAAIGGQGRFDTRFQPVP